MLLQTWDSQIMLINIALSYIKQALLLILRPHLTSNFVSFDCTRRNTIQYGRLCIRSQTRVVYNINAFIGQGNLTVGQRYLSSFGWTKCRVLSASISLLVNQLWNHFYIYSLNSSCATVSYIQTGIYDNNLSLSSFFNLNVQTLLRGLTFRPYEETWRYPPHCCRQRPPAIGNQSRLCTVS